jgi:hypothetical protein
MRKLICLLSLIFFLCGAYSQQSEINQQKPFLSFKKYKVVFQGKSISESETPTSVRTGRDSVKFIGGFHKGFGIRSDAGIFIETTNRWQLTISDEFAICTSPDRSLSIFLTEPMGDTIPFPDKLVPNTDITGTFIPVKTFERTLHNMPVYKTTKEDVPYMPVARPDSSYYGFLLMEDGGAYNIPPQSWLDSIKHNLYQRDTTNRNEYP